MVTDFDPPERFIAGTVGPPGERVFFLQARRSGRVMTVSLEKLQVQLLGERLDSLLDQVAQEESSDAAVDAVADNAPMDTPIEDEFRVQALSMAWDTRRGVVVIEAHEVAEEEESEAGSGEQAVSGQGPGGEEAGSPVLPGGVMRVVLDPARARAFVRRCESAVAGGRPSCPFCGQPLDPSGHICPRANGYRR